MVNTARIAALAVLASAGLVGTVLAAPAPQAVVDSIQAAIPGTPITSVETTPLEGVYEVTAGQNLFYMQPGKPFLLVGSLFDLKASADMTQPKRDKLKVAQFGVKWGEIPGGARISTGDGKAKREVVAFLDVDCPYCKQAYRLLQAATGIRVHYVMLPLDGLHPDAHNKTLDILCADDPKAALDRGMAGQPVAKAAQAGCHAKAEGELAVVAKYASTHQIQGTPFFVTNDGLVVPGLGDSLAQWIQGGK